MTVWLRLRRHLQLRLLVPLLRGRREPLLAARATAIGLFWAFTPTFGIRMPLVFVTWLAMRYVMRSDFTLVIGLAWTWATNALVTLPLYFGFYVTGKLLLGDPAGILGFADFREIWAPLMAPGLDWDQRLYQLGAHLVGEWGPVLWLGALPWACLTASLGYLAALRFLRHRHGLHRRWRRTT